MQLLVTLAHEQGVAVVVSTHDLELALRIAHRPWLFGGGGLLMGAPEDLVLASAHHASIARRSDPGIAH
jgi:iron complex transport system ATP-binding protein